MAEVNDSMGASLRYHTAAAGSAGTLVPQVFEMGPVGLGRALRDVTTLSDTVHKHKLNIPDLSEIAVKLYWDSQDPTHLALWNFATLGSLLTWTIAFEQGNSPFESVQFSAYIVNPQIDPISVDGDLVMSFSLKPQSLVSELMVT